MFRRSVSALRVIETATRKMNARDQYVVGIDQRLNGSSTSWPIRQSVFWASRMASPVRGTIGENQRCPFDGEGLRSERAPIENIDRFGTPNVTCSTSAN